VAVWLWTGVLGAILEGPMNTLVVRCVDEYANMTCVGNDTVGRNPGDNTIAWTYDGNTVIGSPCVAYTGAFLSSGQSNKECNIAASLTKARNDPFVRIISGPYGCTDQTNRGVTATSMAIVLGISLI